MSLFLWCIVGYLVGSFPTGYILMKLCEGIDLREFGSHSTGATNVLRGGNKKLAILTLLIDVFKGFAFTLLLKLLCPDYYCLVAGFFCLVGHVYPIWLNFKGGKGVSTSAGIYLVISPLFAFVSIATWCIVGKFSKVSSIASLSLSFSFCMLCLFGLLIGKTSLSVFLFSLVCLGFILFTHMQNISRLMHKEEPETILKTSSRKR